MSSYIYKNLLIVERCSNHTPTVLHLRNTNVLFSDKHVNLLDKIVLYYLEPFVPDSRVHVLHSEHFMPLVTVNYVGIMNLDCHKNNVTLLDTNFNSYKNLIQCKNQTNEFLDKMKYTHCDLHIPNVNTINNVLKPKRSSLILQYTHRFSFVTGIKSSNNLL
jgi:hypothetical protein